MKFTGCCRPVAINFTEKELAENLPHSPRPICRFHLRGSPPLVKQHCPPGGFLPFQIWQDLFSVRANANFMTIPATKTKRRRFLRIDNKERKITAYGL